MKQNLKLLIFIFLVFSLQTKSFSTFGNLTFYSQIYSRDSSVIAIENIILNKKQAEVVNFVVVFDTTYKYKRLEVNKLRDTTFDDFSNEIQVKLDNLFNNSEVLICPQVFRKNNYIDTSLEYKVKYFIYSNKFKSFEMHKYHCD